MRRSMAFVLALWLVLLAVHPVQAGGWATVTVDGWPQRWVAGEQYTIGVMVRGHGVSPIMVGRTIRIEARSQGDRVTVEAVATDREGYYQAELSLPSPGEWQIRVGNDAYAETVVTTQVVEPGVLAAGVVRWWMALPIMALIAGAAAIRRGVRWRWLAIGSTALVVVAAVFALFAEPGYATSADKVRYGQELFLVKGCARCHIHADAKLDWSSQVGPELTAYQPDKTWVRRWLTDPAAVRPNTQMPNLELAPHEIEALIAFLDAD